MQILHPRRREAPGVQAGQFQGLLDRLQVRRGRGSREQVPHVPKDTAISLPGFSSRVRADPGGGLVRQRQAHAPGGLPRDERKLRRGVEVQADVLREPRLERAGHRGHPVGRSDEHDWDPAMSLPLPSDVPMPHQRRGHRLPPQQNPGHPLLVQTCRPDPEDGAERRRCGHGADSAARPPGRTAEDGPRVLRRRENAHRLITAGKHPKYIAKQARHYSAGFTLDRYGDLFETVPITPVEWIDGLLWPSGFDVRRAQFGHKTAGTQAENPRPCLRHLVGEGGFEPPASASRTLRAKPSCATPRRRSHCNRRRGGGQAAY